MRKFLFLVVTIIMGMTAAFAQMDPSQPLPADKEIRKGVLPNGLTYYIRHNEKPKGMAEFYILHDVGAIQEDDNQQGLAHFLEHMAFNGTERYPDKTILNFLEKDGVRFGYNVNAYTSRTETVYNISAVPQARESFVDSVLFILHQLIQRHHGILTRQIGGDVVGVGDADVGGGVCGNICDNVAVNASVVGVELEIYLDIGVKCLKILNRLLVYRHLSQIGVVFRPKAYLVGF